jgi:hypothetical protein
MDEQTDRNRWISMRRLKIGPDNLQDFVRAISGIDDATVDIIPEDFLIRFSGTSVTGTNVKYECSFPRVRPNFNVWGKQLKGERLLTSTGVIRFHRDVLRHERVNPLFPYHFSLPLHMDPFGAQKMEAEVFGQKNLFYIANFWTSVGEMLSTFIRIGQPEGFRAMLSSYIQKLELIQNDWGYLVMGNEVRNGIPEIEECIGWNQSQHSLLEVGYCIYAADNGYSLSATSKSTPGSVFTEWEQESRSKRIMLSLVLCPISARRMHRAEREMRNIRTGWEFVEPARPSIFLKGYRIKEESPLLKTITEVPILICDFPENVPMPYTEGGDILDTSNWKAETENNKDIVICTELGARLLRVKQRVRETMDELKYKQEKSWLEKQKDYVLYGPEEVFEKLGNGEVFSGYFYKQYIAEWVEEEESAGTCKVVTKTGAKGMTSRCRTRIFVSHNKDFYYKFNPDKTGYDQGLEGLLMMGMAYEVGLIFSASAIRSKKSEALILHSVLTRLAREKGKELEIHDLLPTEWISPSRTDAVEMGGELGEYPDYVQYLSKELKDRGQRLDGTMYVFRSYGNEIIPILDTSGDILTAVFGYTTIWRTPHADRNGSDSRAHPPTREEGRRKAGVAVDRHAGFIGGVRYSIPNWQENHINMLHQGTEVLHKYAEMIEPAIVDASMMEYLADGVEEED